MKPAASVGGNDDGRRAGELHQVGVAHPVRGGDDNLVTRAANRHQSVMQRVLRAVGDDHLRGLGPQPVMARVVARRSPGEAPECQPGECSGSNRRKSLSTPPAGCYRACRNRARPSAKSSTSIPFAFNRRASAPIMSVAEGAIKFERDASVKGTTVPPRLGRTINFTNGPSRAASSSPRCCLNNHSCRNAAVRPDCGSDLLETRGCGKLC